MSPALLIFVLLCFCCLVSGVLWLMFSKVNFKSHVDHQQLLVAVHNQQLLEHHKEQERAVGALEKTAVQNEAKKNLLNDATTENTLKTGRIPWEVAPVVFLVALSVYALTGGFQQYQHWQTAVQRLPYLSQFLLNTQDESLTWADHQDMLLGIRTKLSHDPHDYRGWWFLGRLYLDQGRAAQAVHAFSKGYDLNPQSTMIWLPYAQALALNNEAEKATEFVNKVLAADPQNTNAMLLLGSLLWEKGEQTNAIALWSQLYETLDPKTEQAQWLANLLEQSTTQQSDTPSLDPLFHVQVAVAGEYSASAPHAQLVVFVKSARTGNMPILAQQIKQPQFPITVTLTEQDAVMQDIPDWNTVESLEISARLVAASDVRVKEGALEDTVTILGGSHKEVIQLNLQPLNSAIVDSNP